MLRLPRLALWATACLMATQAVHAQDRDFQAGHVAIDGVDYPYLLLPPAELKEGQKYPLILFLHGAGERGNDNRKQRAHFPARMANWTEGPGADCFVLAPQCPENVAWTQFSWELGKQWPLAASPVPAQRAAVAALQQVVREQPIDLDRISLTGLSMGGFGSWELAARQPGWFSAVVPICGGGDPRMAIRYAGLPMQVWHGGADEVVEPRWSKALVDAMKELKLAVDYFELEGVGHDSWTAAYGSEDAHKLLFEARRDPVRMQQATARLLADVVPASERIAFLGDSITQAGNRPGGYVDRIRGVLHGKHAELGVIPAGISGHKVPDLLKRFRADVVDKQASLVFIYIGINDVWHSQNGRGTPIAVFEAGLHELIQELKASGATVVLSTPSVIGEKSQGQNKLDQMLDEYAAVSRRVAAKEELVLCDLRQAFLDHLSLFNPTDLAKGVLTTDGVHLNEAGNLLVATEAARSLREAVARRDAQRAAAQAER